jgi:peptidoglycan/xylan/chitin deacetylase (PgdA/CDA1 family)
VGPLRSAIAASCLLLDQVRRRRDLSVVACVDVEPDLRAVDRAEPVPWLGFERLLERVPELRRELLELSGAPVAFTWCLRMDPQVAETWGSPAWVRDAYGDALAQLVDEGDELGLHTHTWRWSDDRGEWIAEYDDPAWEEHCVTMALEAFEDAFGRPCLTHRGGDHFLSPAMLARLGKAGVAVDLTLEPGWPPVGPPGGERSHGLLPDYRRIPTHPYRSTPDAFPAPDPGARNGPLLVPLFSPPGLRRRQRLPLPPDSRHFVPRLAFELMQGTPPVLVTVLRSDAANSDAWGRVEENLEHLARHRRASFLTAGTAATRFQRVAAG